MSECVKEITDKNFKDETSSGLILVDFFADWCGPCKRIAPIIEELADEVKDFAKIGKMDIDQYPKTPQELGITSIPTLIIFKNGKEVDKIVGMVSKADIKSKLEKHK